ncbi:MAG: tyrosine-type recombinase/integrase [Halanaerobiales bacterium]
MPYITQTESGKWQAQAYVGKDPNTNKYKRKYKTFKRKKDAENWAKEVELEASDGIVIEPGEITLGELLRRWLNNYKNKIAGSTYDGYKGKIESHLIPALGAIKLKDLQPLHVETYFSKKRIKGRKDGKSGGLSENTLHKHYVILNKAMKQAVKWRLIKVNPVAAIESPQPEDKEKKAMTEAEFNKLMKVAKKEDCWMFNFLIVAIFTGMRRSEILGLHWSEVEFENKIIRVTHTLVPKIGEGSVLKNKTKNKSSKRSIKISDTVVKVLKEHKKMQTEIRLQLGPKYNDTLNLVFCKEDGTKYYPGTINKKLNRLLKKADLPLEYGIHTMRHTFATINLKNGVNPKIVQEMLGHSTIATTLDVYSHVTPDMQQEAVDKMDKSINID